MGKLAEGGGGGDSELEKELAMQVLGRRIYGLGLGFRV